MDTKANLTVHQVTLLSKNMTSKIASTDTSTFDPQMTALASAGISSVARHSQPDREAAAEAQNQLIARIEMENGISFMVNRASLPLTMGRDAKSGICILQNQVSRRHCELYLENDELRLKDVSTNGTEVDGRRLQGDSTPIESRTEIAFTTDTTLFITPFRIEERRQTTDRRVKDRRTSDRRTEDIVVDLERRKQNRRITNRRIAVRR